MDFTHWHLLLNHFPIIGTMAGVGLLLISFLVNLKDLRRSSLIVFVVAALLTIPAFVTGFGAQVRIVEDPNVSNVLIQRHLGSAELSLWFMVITGGLAAIGLWQFGRQRRQASWNSAAVLVFSVSTALLMARTGNTGGEIRHAEVRVDQQASATEALMAYFEPSPPAFTDLMVASKWWWAFMMDMHFIGLVLVVGTIGLLNLRVLGFAKRLPIAPLNKLVPWGLAGFGINLVTGMLAFIGMSAYYTFNIAFILKVGVMLLAVASLALFYATSAFHDCEGVGPGEDAPPKAKLLAGASLVLWFGVIVLGRYIQPLENSIPR
jgi:uncharacterized membrane protein